MKFVVSDGTVYRFLTVTDFGRIRVYGISPSGELRNFWDGDVKFLPDEAEVLHPVRQEVMTNASNTNVQSPDRVRPSTRKKVERE